MPKNKVGLAHAMIQDEEIRHAVEILNRKGFGGKAVYVPRLYEKRTLRKLVDRMLEKGISESEIAEILGVPVELVKNIVETRV